MGYSTKTATLLFTVVVVAVMMASRPAVAQPACAMKLVPCVDYLNATTRPPATCCNPLTEAVTKELKCLCDLYEDPNFLKSLGINVTEALRLPGLCGIPSSVSACKASAPSPTELPPPPPGIPGNNVGKIASTGVYSLLLLSAASMMLY